MTTEGEDGAMPARLPGCEQYDVVVVGARNAGAATAMLLARAGHRVLVVDRAHLPSDTVSTHAILLGGLVQLTRWGLLPAVQATGAARVTGIEMSVGDVSFTAPVKPIGGVSALYAPRRLRLDAVLVSAATAAGAELVTGATVTDVVRDHGGRVRGVTGRAADGTRFAVGAEWVVGADGVRSRVARRAGAERLRYAPPSSACRYAYFKDLPATNYEFAFQPGAGAGAVPTDDGLVCVYASYPLDEPGPEAADVDGGFRRLVAAASPDLAERVASARRVSSYRGARGLPGYLRRPWGPGWALVGDAGYHRDPLSAHGMTDAFRDAELAARALHGVLSGATDERDALDEYHARRDDLAVPFFEATARLASYRWTVDEVLELLADFGEAGEREARFLADLPDLPDRVGVAA